LHEQNIVGVVTNKGSFAPLLVVNCAGVHSDTVAGLAGDSFFKINPRIGLHTVLDKKYGHMVSGTVGLPPDRVNKSKGGAVGITTSGNLLVGPDAIEVSERENYQTNKDSIKKVFARHFGNFDVHEHMNINYFQGVRAVSCNNDFIIEQGRNCKNIYHVAGIQSPGQTAAPQIAKYVERQVVDILTGFKGEKVEENANFNPVRKGIPELYKLGFEERAAKIAQNPDYGVIVCRCEEVSKGEIIDALNSPIKVKTLDAVKRRVRAGMGRCGGAFCCPLVSQIISEQTGIPLEEIEKGKPGSHMFTGVTK
jgi:glycerol-3-phosphate dehydrogenase